MPRPTAGRTARQSDVDRENRITEHTTSLLDYLSRAVGAIRDGNGDYLHAKLHELGRALTSLTAAAQERKQFNGPVVTAKIAHAARHYSAGRRLFPVDDDPVEAARQRALEKAATDLQFDPPDGLVPEATAVVARWLRDQAKKPA